MDGTSTGGNGKGGNGTGGTGMGIGCNDCGLGLVGVVMNNATSTHACLLLRLLYLCLGGMKVKETCCFRKSNFYMIK